jgi:enamine deaminase RidA (YjgF/YER057c/UK114 family)
MDKLIKLFEELFGKIDPEGTLLPESYKEQLIASIKESIETHSTVQVEEKVAEVTKELTEQFEVKEDEAATKIEEATSKLTEAVDSAKQEALTELDEQHAAELDECLSSILSTIESIKEQYTTDTDHLEDAIELYFEQYLQNNEPEEAVVEAVRLEKAISLIEAMKSIMFKEGELEVLVKENDSTQIEDMDKLVENNIKMASELKTIKGEKHLTEKLEPLKPSTAEFVKSKLTGKSVEDIDKLFETVVAEFEGDEDKELDEARKKADKRKIDKTLDENKDEDLEDEIKLTEGVAEGYLKFFHN